MPTPRRPGPHRSAGGLHPRVRGLTVKHDPAQPDPALRTVGARRISSLAIRLAGRAIFRPPEI